MPGYNYPKKPEVEVNALLALPPSYRKHVINTLLSMVVFIIGYFVVLVAAIALIYFGAKLALIIVMAKAHWLTLLAAAGIMMVVIMFFVFITKFLFKIKKEDPAGKIEIKREDHPLLFEFIERVCNETKAPFPKKIVLSSDVNACVYYNSSFLSMFFPVRKNLEIGLGLVNCVNLTEFKAIVAHEFGHFSQSSTRLGSYVYRFNRIMHDLLYDNSGWSDTLQSISNIHAVLAFFGHITVALVKAVISFFILLFKLVNLSYMSLSREMEFNADNVAVSVTGSKPIISALYRLEFGQDIFNYTAQGTLNYGKEEAVHPKNFFKLMQRNLVSMAKLNKLDIQDGLPIINTELAKKNFLDARVVYKDIWATHPPTEEREKNANRIFIDCVEVKDSPWSLFTAPEKLQEKMSALMPVFGLEKKKAIDNDVLVNHFEAKENEATIDPVYKDYYNNLTETFASPQTEDMGKLADMKKITFDQLFNDQVTLKLKYHQKNLQDTEVVKQISEGHLDVRRFEFDGKQYTRYYSAEIYKKLKEETELEEKNINEHKQKIANWFFIHALEKDQALAQNFRAAMDFRLKIAKDRTTLGEHIKTLLDFYQKDLSQSITEDDLPPLREKLKKMYGEFSVYRAGFSEEGVPAFLINDKIMPLGYKSTIFKGTIDDPTLQKNFEGIEAYYNGLNSLMVNFAELDNKVFYHVLGIQNDILKRLNLN